MRIKVFVTVYKYYSKSFVRTNQVLKQKFVCTIPYIINKRDDTAISGKKFFANLLNKSRHWNTDWSLTLTLASSSSLKIIQNNYLAITNN